MSLVGLGYLYLILSPHSWGVTLGDFGKALRTVEAPQLHFSKHSVLQYWTDTQPGGGSLSLCLSGVNIESPSPAPPWTRCRQPQYRPSLCGRPTTKEWSCSRFCSQPQAHSPAYCDFFVNICYVNGGSKRIYQHPSANSPRIRKNPSISSWVCKAKEVASTPRRE